RCRTVIEAGAKLLDPATRDGLVNLDAGLRVQPGSAVVQVVPGHAGYGRVRQSHGGHRLGDPARLAGIERGRLAGVDLAEVTPPGALVAADEERCLAVFPALEDVRASGRFADRVQLLAADQVLERGVLRPRAQPRLDPRRL